MSTPPDQNIPFYMAELHPRFLNEGEIDPAVHADLRLVDDGIALNRSLVQLVNEQSGANPYISVVAYDPASMLAQLDATEDEYKVDVRALDPGPDWQTFTDRAMEAYDDDFGDDLSLDVTFRAKYRQALKRMDIEAARFVAAAADLNAVHSDTFIRGIAMMEGDLLASLQDEELKLELLDKQLRLSYVQQAVANMIQMLGHRTDSMKNVALIDGDNVKATITANSNYYREEMDIVINEAKWQLDAFGEIGAFMGAINGAPRISTTHQSPMQQFITTALPIAGMTGMAGMQVGGAPGAGIGALIGLVGTGLFQAAGR